MNNPSFFIPPLGLGTWKSAPGQVGAAVQYALTEAGYDHIDCAAIYRNEPEVGQALAKVFSGARKREDVFITSKLWNTEHQKDRVRKACEKTLSDLNLEYLDLYLMHWGIAIPPRDSLDPKASGSETEQKDNDGFLITAPISIRETWEAMEDLVQRGLVKAIGVSNFSAPMLIDLLSYAKIKPATNQIELHPYFQQQNVVDFCQHNNVTVTAYSPLGSPGNYRDKVNLLEDEVIVRIAKDHNKTPAQIILRWGIQRGTAVIPKSTTPERIKENRESLDFELSEQDMKDIAGIERNTRMSDVFKRWKIPYFN